MKIKTVIICLILLIYQSSNATNQSVIKNIGNKVFQLGTNVKKFVSIPFEKFDLLCNNFCSVKPCNYIYEKVYQPMNFVNIMNLTKKTAQYPLNLCKLFFPSEQKEAAEMKKNNKIFHLLRLTAFIIVLYVACAKSKQIISYMIAQLKKHIAFFIQNEVKAKVISYLLYSYFFMQLANINNSYIIND